MITTQNYLNTACNYDFSAFPEPLKKGDDLTRKVLAQNSYSENDTIKRVVDTYIEKLNAFLEQQPPKKAKATPDKPNKVSSTPAQKQKAKKAPVKSAPKKPAAAPKPVEILPEELRFIRRYVAMHGK